MPNGFKIFGGTAHPSLVESISNDLGILPGKIRCKRFADGEISLQIIDNVRGSEVFLVQPTCPPTDTNIIELVLMADAFRRSSVKSLSAVLPYFGYARQDRKDKPRVPISASVIAGMIQHAGFDRILAMDLHSAPIQGFCEIPVDHLYALPLFIEHLRTNPIADATVVSPDVGGVARARMFAEKINAPLAIIEKRRMAANQSEVLSVIGDVKDRNCIIIDDIIDTAGTLVHGATAIQERGAKSVRAYASHGVLSADAKKKIQDSCIVEVVITDTIPHVLDPSGKIKQISVSKLFAEAINAVYSNTSVSHLFV